MGWRVLLSHHHLAAAQSAPVALQLPRQEGMKDQLPSDWA
jgi:hypothetical protein